MNTLTISISSRVFNSVYLPFLEDQRRYLVFYGGAGSGKSVFICQRYLYRLLREPGRNLLVVRGVERANRTSTFALFKQTIQSWGLSAFFKVREDEMRIVCLLGGSEILFRGLSDVEQLKSITFTGGVLTDVWIEEASEIAEKDFQQLDVRLRGRGRKKQMVLSFNPISMNHWLKRRFFDHPMKEVGVLHTTYRNNRFLDAEYQALLESYRESDPYYYQVYCLGQWGVYGNTVFDREKTAAQLSRRMEQKPLREGYFQWREEGARLRDIHWVDAQDGYIRLYRLPEQGQRYVLGGDTAGEGSDAFVGQVMAVASGEQVAVLRHRMDEDLYAKQIYCLGAYYAQALVGIETNFSTFPVRELQRLGYPHQFVRRSEDDYTHRLHTSYGFRTTSVTRPVILSMLITFARENPEKINDVTTLEEMLTFVRNRSGRPEAQSGAHDDCVMALAIACYLRESWWEQGSTGEGTDTSGWTEDMWEDYRQANEEEKRYLLQRWGCSAVSRDLKG